MTAHATGWLTPMFRTLSGPLGPVVGGDTAAGLEALGLETVHDLVRHLPVRLQAGTEESDLEAIYAEQQAALSRGEVLDDHVAVLLRIAHTTAHLFEPGKALKDARGGRRHPGRLTADLTDGHGRILRVTWFGTERMLVQWYRDLRRTSRGLFVGRLGWFQGDPQLVNPDFVSVTPDGAFLGSGPKRQIAEQVSQHPFIGIYRQSARLPTWTISSAVGLVVDAVKGLPDPMPAWVREAADLPELGAAIVAAHLPTSRDEHARGVERVRFDEAFATQAAMAYRRADASRHLAVRRPPAPGGLVDRLDARLPFRLTDEQVAVCDEIFADLDRTRPMQRLLQGEVGSGKTVVALRAMLRVVDAGGQAVLLAPTEVLAQQHHQSILGLLGELGQGPVLGAPEGATDVVLLTGSTPAAARRAALDRLADGSAGLAVGTHALLHEGVDFADLGLVVVDEQHRFGVEQRNALGVRGDRHPHVLVMTATPIPRSVAMTVFGDLDVSTIRHPPTGRAGVQTSVVDTRVRPEHLARVWQRIREDVAQGRQAFVVVPRIKAEAGPGHAVEETYEQLRDGPLQGLRLAMLHGRMSTAAKRDTMADFAAGAVDVLVATTVVEVGVDVPNATVMVVLDAESYGVSQLHQLRGRIGRGPHRGVCILVTASKVRDETEKRPKPVSNAHMERLYAVQATTDGFELAEVDLRQRREGDVLGLRQSGGRSSLRVIRVLEHAELLETARDLAQQVVARDPDLTDPGVRDYVRQIELLAADEWAEAT